VISQKKGFNFKLLDLLMSGTLSPGAVAATGPQPLAVDTVTL
jgi:hypothetical protein